MERHTDAAHQLCDFLHSASFLCLQDLAKEEQQAIEAVVVRQQNQSSLFGRGRMPSHSCHCNGVQDQRLVIESHCRQII